MRILPFRLRRTHVINLARKGIWSVQGVRQPVILTYSDGENPKSKNKKSSNLYCSRKGAPSLRHCTPSHIRSGPTRPCLLRRFITLVYHLNPKSKISSPDETMLKTPKKNDPFFPTASSNGKEGNKLVNERKGFENWLHSIS